MHKKYQLANTEFRKTINLCKYKKSIEEAVHQIKPDARIIVRKDGFEVYPELTKIESIQVSRILRSGCLEQFTMYRPCLFNGYIVEKEEND